MAPSECALNNYTKGEVIVRNDDPSLHFPEIPSKTVIVRIKSGSRMKNIVGFALRMLKEQENRHIILTGNGNAIYKVISCTEILKRKHENLYQITKICSLRQEEFWEPKNSELDRLKVTREIPQIHILLCKDELDSSISGYQAPGQCDPLGSYDSQRKRRQVKRPSYSSQNTSSHKRIVFNRDRKRKAKNNDNEDGKGVEPKTEGAEN